MAGKSDRDPSIAKRLKPWLWKNNGIAVEDIDLGFKKLEADLKGLSPAQKKLIYDLMDQMKISNEENNELGNQKSKYK